MYGNGISTGGALPAAPMGYANITGEATAPAPASEVLRHQLEAAIERVHQSIGNVRGFADATMGERGEKAGLPGKDVPSRGGRIGALSDRVDTLHASLATLDSEIARLNAI